MFDSDEKTTAQQANIEVTAARTTKNNNTVMFDMKYNGVSISGCSLREVICKKDGEKHKAGDKCYIVGFPQRKYNDKYYNIVWAPISSNDTAEICKQVKEKLKG